MESFESQRRLGVDHQQCVVWTCTWCGIRSNTFNVQHSSNDPHRHAHAPAVKIPNHGLTNRENDIHLIFCASNWEKRVKYITAQPMCLKTSEESNLGAARVGFNHSQYLFNGTVIMVWDGWPERNLVSFPGNFPIVLKTPSFLILEKQMACCHIGQAYHSIE